MANPQKENGHTALANDIWDALARYRLSGEEWKCLIVIIRKTYGWQKKSDRISLSQFSEKADLKKQSASRALKSLSAKGLIGISKNADRETLEYCFHKDFDKWKPISKKAYSKQKCLHPISNIAKEPISKNAEHKRNNTKETITKEKDIEILGDHILKVLKINLSDKKQTENLIKTHGLDLMISCVDRMKQYFDAVAENKWTVFVIGKYWRNLYEKLEYFISDENLQQKLKSMAESNKQKKPDCRTVSTDFSSDEKLMREQQEKARIKELLKNAEKFTHIVEVKND